ncbi:MAG: chromate transporter [Candidatus Rokuibacteriota bacterium]|nr:MAG: chromate transporter [Candidatus Rokubacteria bacterium]
MARAAKREHAGEVVSLGALFASFLKVSLFGVGGGGGLVWARRIGVEQRQWITEGEFADIVSLCQFMPGPNIIGIAVCTGARLRGARGTLAAVAGFLLIPWVVGFTLGVALLQHAHLPVLRNILGGLSAAAAGLLIATGIRMLMPHRGRAAALIFAGLAFGLMAVGKLPLLLVLFGLLPLSIGVAGLEHRRAR